MGNHLFKKILFFKKSGYPGGGIQSVKLAMARKMRSRRGRLSGDSIVLNFHEFANELAKHKGAAKVQKLDDLLTEFSDHALDDFDGRIALLETKHGATKNVYETKYHDVCQILNHKIRNGDHRWVTQTWNQSGDKEKNGKCVNSPDDLFLLPKNKSVITYGKKKKKISGNVQLEHHKCNS